MKKYFLVAALVAGAACISAALPRRAAPAGVAPPAGERYTNLQVLPKDISNAILNRIMIEDFEDGLGVACGYCHAGADYASDAKPEKRIARAMMKMTLTMNKRFFKVKHPAFGSLTVTCVTCHQGDAFPDGTR